MNTVFFDEDGNFLYFSQDDFDNAIVVISEDKVSDFHQSKMAAVLSPDYVTAGDVEELRGFGDNYMVEGLEQLWGKSMSEKSTEHEFYRNKKKAELSPEYAADFSVGEGNNGNSIFSVDKSTYRTDNHPQHVPLGALKKQPVAHTHPASGSGLTIKDGQFFFPISFSDNEPSGVDWQNATSPRHQNFNAIISKDMIILYKKSGSDRKVINVNRSYFQKK